MGMTQPGEANPHAKLNEAKARAIRMDPRTAPEVAPEYGVSPTTIREVRNGKRWAHVPMPKNMPSWPRGKAGHRAYRDSTGRAPLLALLAILASWALFALFAYGLFWIHTHGFTAWVLTIIVFGFLGGLFWTTYMSPEARIARQCRTLLRADRKAARKAARAGKELEQ